jgi:glycosyltransferase involved in cell wall biosynthesis
MALPVSCIITSYNNRATLTDAVRSVLAQTAPVAEIVIADDGSTDGTRDLIASLASDHTAITPVLRDQNLGVAANRDRAIRAARQPIVTHLDGDDRFAPGKIAAEWRALGEKTDRVAFSDIALIHPGRPWRSSVLDTTAFAGKGPPVLERLVARSHPIPRDMFMAKSLFEQAGGFRAGLSLYEDWDFKLSLALEQTDWVHSGALGTLYMQRGAGLSRTSEDRLLAALAGILSARKPALEEALDQARFGAALAELFGPGFRAHDLETGTLPRPMAPRATLTARLGNKARALRHLRDIWAARHG